MQPLEEVTPEPGVERSPIAERTQPTPGSRDVGAMLLQLLEWTLERFRLDGSSLTDPAAQRDRQALFGRIRELKSRILGLLSAPDGYPQASLSVQQHVRSMLDVLGKHIENAINDPHSTDFERLAKMERMRADFAWTLLLVDWLGDEEFRDPGLTIRSDIDRLKRMLSSASDATQVAEYLRLDREFEEIRRQTLLLRARRDTTAALDESTPESCWSRRWTLSRLQAELSLGLHGLASEGSKPELDESVRELRSRRQALADRAADLIRAMDPRAAVESWTSVVHLAQGDVNEVVAYLHDAQLRKSIVVLDLMREDLERLELQAREMESLCGAEGAPPAPISANRSVRRLLRQVRDNLQDKRLAEAVEARIGRGGAAWLERAILALVLGMMVLISAEAYWEARYDPSHAVRETFAWIEFALCSVFLSEFFFKLALCEDRKRYFRRHLLVDFIASIPFGFFAHHLEHIEYSAAESLPQLLRLLRLMRIPALARYLRAMQPLIRLVRLSAFLLRATDHLVHRFAHIFNQNIILFEPEVQDEFESDVKHQLRRMHGFWQRRSEEMFARLPGADRLRIVRCGLEDIRLRISTPLPYPKARAGGRSTPARSVRVETLVRTLTEMTPERLVDSGGQALADSIHRYIRLFDVPLIRRLPVIRRIVAHRDKGSAEAASLAANYAGHLIQRCIDFCYFFADLYGTISGPIFLDRLGAAMVKATAGPTKRLITLTLMFFFLYGLVQIVGFHGFFRGFLDKTYNVLAGPITILGLLCAIPLFLGVWFKRIANQASEYCERIVEAQFAAQTKALKAASRAGDERFLHERVVVPELQLRRSDDRPDGSASPASTNNGDGTPSESGPFADELLFGGNVEMLYRDYLDGALFHRTDTKTTNQLLGNLALTNLRMSNLEHLLRESKQLRSIDLTRAGSVFGGPYLWFNYINRIITQQTAELILDYNRHAIPLKRLQCAPAAIRMAYERWLENRLNPSAENAVRTRMADDDDPSATDLSTAKVRRGFPMLESVDFTAIDFLSFNDERLGMLERRYGPRIAELIRRDRVEVVRRAFRSFPLHRVPLAKRTINPMVFYDKFIAKGRVFLLPLAAARRLAGLTLHGLRMTSEAIRHVLDPKLRRDAQRVPENYAVARRKINRMRKPVFMRSLWLRARFDIEYVGLPLPTMPLDLERIPTIERDLDFIGANRRERTAAESLRRQHRERTRWIAKWLHRHQLDFQTVPSMLDRDFAFLSHRGAEAVRALATAMIVDHDDLFSLAAAIEGIERCCRRASDQMDGDASMPTDLPPLIEQDHPLWHKVKRGIKPSAKLFDIPGFDRYAPAQRRCILDFLRKHRTTISGWYDVLLGQAQTGADPWGIWLGRAKSVVLRTDLWSDQIVALRTVQSLALLDVYHYCEFVWRLGGYDASENRALDAVLPFASIH